MANSILLTGRITKDLELKQAGQVSKCDFTLAVDREYAKEVNKKIIAINEILKKSQKQFAYRVRDEILFYLVENKKAELLDEDTMYKTLRLDLIFS